MDSFESQLHSAAAVNDLEAAELVLKERMNIIFKYEQGLTPLHLVMKKRIEMYDSLREINESLSSLFRLEEKSEELLYSYEHSNKILELEKKEKLSLHKLKENEKFIEMLLKHASVVPNCTNDHWMIMFCAACTLGHCALAQSLSDKIADVNQSINDNSSLWPGYTGLHFAADCGNINTIKMLIHKGANLLTCDANGITPLDICFKSFSVKEVCSILNHVDAWQNIIFSDGKTKLMNYIHLLLKSNDPKCYLQDVGKVAEVASSKVSLWPGYTTLHLAVHLLPETKYDRIYRILNSGASVTAQDNYGSTPVHLAFCLGKMKFLSILLSYHEKALNLFNKNNLSHLHIASAVSHEHMVKKLLTIEANINIAYNGRPLPKLKPGWTPLHTACFAKHTTVAKMLLYAGAKLFQPHFTSIEEIFPLSKVLTENCNESLLELFVSSLWKEKKLQQLIQEDMGLTLLHIVCYAVDIMKIKVLMKKKIDVNARVREDSPIWAGFTPLHALISSGANHIREGVSEVLQLLLNKEADVTLTDVNGNTPVHLALKSRGKNQGRIWAKNMIEHHCNYSINPTNKEGISHFHISCLVSNPTAVAGFLQWGADVNQPVHESADEFAGMTSLHLVLVLNAQGKSLFEIESQVRIVDLLLKRNVDLNAIDARGCTPLHYVAIYSQGRQEFLDRIVRKDTNMNTEAIEYGKTPFEILIHNEPSIDEIKLFMKHGSRVNSYNRINHKGYMAMIIGNKCKQLTSILKLMMSSPDIAAVDERGRNAIFNSFWCDEIDLSEEELATLIEKLIQLGCDIHQQDRERKTPLHLAVGLRNEKAVSALLMCGADINLIDSTGRSPFGYCAQPAILNQAKNFHPVLMSLIKHLIKLQSVNLEVSQLNRQLLDQLCYSSQRMFWSYCIDIGWIESDDEDVDDEDDVNCSALRNQVKKIKKMKIGKRGMTLYDFVFENDVVKIMSLFTQAEVNFASKVLQSIDYKIFWSLKHLLKLQYRKVLERPALVVAGATSINILFGSSLDDLCIEIIFKYLTNAELKCLVCATI